MPSVHCIGVNSFLVDSSSYGTCSIAPKVSPGHPRKCQGVCFLSSMERYLVSTLVHSRREILLNFFALGHDSKALTQHLSTETYGFPLLPWTKRNSASALAPTMVVFSQKDPPTRVTNNAMICVHPYQLVGSQHKGADPMTLSPNPFLSLYKPTFHPSFHPFHFSF